MPFKKQATRSTQQSTDTKSTFIARANELLFFIHHVLEPEEPTYNIISISGQGGVGKSTLVNRFIAEAYATNFKDYCLPAKVDERQTTPASLMEHFANQLRNAGQPLKKFEEALTNYKESLRRIQSEYEEEQGAVVREAVDIVGTVAEDLPVVGGLVHKGANTVTRLLIDRAQRQQHLKDAASLEDPIGTLTKAFVRDLNQVTEIQIGTGPYGVERHYRIILFFDTFEQLASSAAPWLLDYFLEADINTNVVLVVAGRESIEDSTPGDPKRWLPYLDNKDIYLIALHSFTEQETSSYLEKRRITDPTKVNQIWHMSRGLPLYLGLLTSNPEGNVDPTADVVENFLRWIPKQEQLKRRLALDASLFSLPFNQDDLIAFTYLEHAPSEPYQWLINQPFVRSNPQDGRHSYHDLAQEMFSRHLYQRSPREWYATRQMIANYYKQRIEKLLVEGGKEIYKSVEWLDLTLALAQQLLLLPADFDKAIALVANYARAYAGRGETYRLVKDYGRAISDLNRAIELDPSDDWAYMCRGQTYYALKDYERTIQDYNQALELDPQYKWAYVNRGNVYRNLEDYERAIQDYNQALKLDPQYRWAYVNRGLVYGGLKDYEHAIADFDRAIELDPKYAYAYICRGLAYGILKDYERAIADFDRAIELDPKYAYAYNKRGLVYRDLQDYEHAIADFGRAIELDPQYEWAYANRGLVYRKLKDYERAIQDYNQALKLDPQYAWAYFGRGYVYLWRKDILQAKTDFSQSWQLDSTDVNYGWMIAFVEMCQQKPDLTMVESLKVYAQANLQSYEAYICLGVAQWLQGNFKRALEQLEHALRINSDSEDALFWKGIVHASLQEDDIAIAAIEKSLELDLPPILLSPLRWFEQIRPEFYERYAKPLLARLSD